MEPEMEIVKLGDAIIVTSCRDDDSPIELPELP